MLGEDISGAREQRRQHGRVESQGTWDSPGKEAMSLRRCHDGRAGARQRMREKRGAGWNCIPDEEGRGDTRRSERGEGAGG